MLKLKLLKQTLIVRNKIEYESIRGIRVFKPPWEPRSKKKQFFVPPVHVPDPAVKAYMSPIWQLYKTSMRSLYALFKTEAKFSNTESVKALEERQAEAAAEKIALAQNETENARILSIQMADDEERLAVAKTNVEVELETKRGEERKLVQLADERVKRLKEKVRPFIDPKDFELEIEKALNERKDYNFSIDQKGNIFRQQDSN